MSMCGNVCDKFTKEDPKSDTNGKNSTLLSLIKGWSNRLKKKQE